MDLATLKQNYGDRILFNGASHDTILEETPLENVLTMFDAIGEFGDYPINLD